MALIITFVIGFIAGFIVAKFVLKNKAADFIDEQIRNKEEGKKKIIELLNGKDKITNDEAEEILGVSNATVERYLNELEAEGAIKQVGETGRGVYYVKK